MTQLKVSKRAKTSKILKMVDLNNQNAVKKLEQYGVPVLYKVDKDSNLVYTEKRNKSEQITDYNSEDYRHNDIVFIPKIKMIYSMIEYYNIKKTRTSTIQGSDLYKNIKDYILTFNLSVQPLRTHSVFKDCVVLDTTYLEKALGARHRNDNNKFFDLFFSLERGGLKDNYSSGYKLTKKGLQNDYKIGRVTHVSNLDKHIIAMINNVYTDDSTKQKMFSTVNKPKIKRLLKKEAKKAESNKVNGVDLFKDFNIDDYENLKSEPIEYTNSLKIPVENVRELIHIANTTYKHNNTSIKNALRTYDFKTETLYYNTYYKPYGRNYSTLHSLKKEHRKVLLKGFKEVDLECAAQKIIYNLGVQNSDITFKYLDYYVNNKTKARQEIAESIYGTTDDAKDIVMKLTFNNRLPSKGQMPYTCFFDYYNCNLQSNQKIRDLEEDIHKLDKILRTLITKEEYLKIQEHRTAKKRVKKSKVRDCDIRVYLFQKIESEFMEMLKDQIIDEETKEDEIFHLHDAIYIKDITDQKINRIKEIASTFSLEVSVETVGLEDPTNPAKDSIIVELMKRPINTNDLNDLNVPAIELDLDSFYKEKERKKEIYLKRMSFRIILRQNYIIRI